MDAGTGTRLNLGQSTVHPGLGWHIRSLQPYRTCFDLALVPYIHIYVHIYVSQNHNNIHNDSDHDGRQQMVDASLYSPVGGTYLGWFPVLRIDLRGMPAKSR